MDLKNQEEEEEDKIDLHLDSDQELLSNFEEGMVTEVYLNQKST